VPGVGRPLSAARPLANVSLLGLGLAAVLAVGALAGLPAHWDWWAAHGGVALYAFLLPAFAGFTAHALSAILGRPADERKARVVALLWLAGSVVLGADQLALHGTLGRVAAGLGALVLLAAAGMTTGLLLRALPKRRDSVVDVARDPLTKGDDASAAHLRFAQFFLPLGVLLAVLPLAVPGMWHARGVGLAGAHLLAAHALVSCYGLAHLWVPRLSGVPAIAAGAIKGELHSTLLGIVFLLAGFAFDVRGLLIAGGAFAFLGAFTFMGVIGANIMRNKSKTQRVTREFTYIPWAFTAVFWLLSGVLLGIFLNVVPDAFAAKAAALRFTHVHIALLGGAAQLLLALAWRLVPAARGASPPPFAGGARFGFFALNLGLAALLAGRFGATSPSGSNLFVVGTGLVVLGLGASFVILQRHGRRPPVTA
jgi:hypothetical protein